MKLRTRTIERLRDALLASGRRHSEVVSPAYAALARRNLLTEREREALNRVDGVAEVMFLVMAADEQITDTELAALRGAIRGLTADALHDGIVDVMLEAFALRLQDHGREARLRSIASQMTDPAEAESAFALAAAVALADDDVAETERQLIKQIAGWFGLSQEQTAIILGQIAEDRRA